MVVSFEYFYNESLRIILQEMQEVEATIKAKKRVLTLKEAADETGTSYMRLWRAAIRGDLRPLKGFGRITISSEELNRFLSDTVEYSPRKGKNLVLKSRVLRKQ
jgi:hypothetical protein